MRSLLVVGLLGSVAYAEALPVDVVTAGRAGDWTIFDGVRRIKDKLVDERAFVMLSAAKIEGAYGTRVVIGMMRVDWHRGDRTKVTPWRDEKFAGPVEPRLFAVTTTVKDFQTAATTCKLGTSFPCTKVTYRGQWIDDPSKEVTVTATMADRVIGTGLVDLEVMDNATVMLRYKVTGYGHGNGKRWGVSADGIKLGVKPPTPPTKDTPRWVGIDQPIDPGPRVGTMSAVESTGDLDNAIIRRYLKRNFQKLVYCYEKEQLAKPKIAGKVDVTFAIAADGKVSASSAKGVDPEVERCVAGVVMRIEFPKPKSPTKIDAKFSMTYVPWKPAGKKS